MISIIVPAYNSENTIVPLIESVLKSDYLSYELIIVDDCSTDNTVKKIKPYLRNNRIRLIKLKKNSGPAKARNVGAKIAKYNILFYIDSDVEIFPNTLKIIQRSYKEKPEMSAMIGICHINPINKGLFPKYRALLEYSWFLNQHNKKNTFFTPRVGTIKKNVLLELGGFDEKYKGADVEDYEFGYRLTNKYDIYINTKVQVKHFFPTYLQNAKNYYKRGVLWTKLFLERLKFDNVGTSLEAAIETLLQSLTIFLFILSVFYPIIFIPLSLTLIVIVYLMRNFLILTLRKGGPLFMMWAFMTRYSLSFVVSASFIVGTLKYIIKHPKVERQILLLRSFLNVKQPSYLIFFVTSQCNSKCKMCFNWKNIEEYKKRKILSLNEIKKIAKHFKTLYHITLSGGEPVLRDDIPEIVKVFYKYSNMRSLTFTTNGLLTKKIVSNVEQILKECPNILIKVPLSINGLFEKHDKIHGIRGNFKKLEKTYFELKKLQERYKNLVITATTVMSKFNKVHIREILTYVDSRWNVNNHVVLLARGNTREKDAKDVSIREYKELFEYIDEINSKKHKRIYHLSKFYNLESTLEKYLILATLKKKTQVIPCLAGKRMIILGDTGDVEPCEVLKYFLEKKNKRLKSTVMGNVRNYNYNINTILKSKQAKKIIKFIKDKKCYCTFECAMAVNIVFNPIVFLMSSIKFFKKIN